MNETGTEKNDLFLFMFCENAGARNERRCSWILLRNDEGVSQDEYTNT
jgi:hypothetical protein